MNLKVKLWKGTVKKDPTQTNLQIKDYLTALKEILKYSIDMYNTLYEILVDKMQGQYQDMFVDKVLNNLLSEKAFDVAAKITSQPHCDPNNRNKDRDTAALSLPAKLSNEDIGEEPFRYEVNTRGNQYANGRIPSYSYSCVNFRGIFHKIVNKLIKEYKIKALFSTFIDIVLKDETVTTYTGYTFSNCKQDSFKFDQFIDVRDLCTKVLKKNNLVEDDDKWKRFSYSSIGKKYIGSEAIAVLVYENLIKSFKLDNTFSKYRQSILKNECSTFVEINKKEDILNQMSRN